MAVAQQQQYMGVQGEYTCLFTIGGISLPLTPESFTAIDIVEYIDRFLPSFTITIKDSSGALAHNLVNDNKFGQISIMFSGANRPGIQKWMTFRVYRKKSEGHTEQSNEVTFCGLLDVPNMFAPDPQRGWVNKPVSQILRDIGADMKIQNYDIDTGLTAPITIVQPRWSNAMFLGYLADRLVGAGDDAGFFVFVDSSVASVLNPKGANRLTFKSINSFLKQGSTKTLSFDKESTSTVLPIINHEIIENFMLYNLLGTASKKLSYFDYEQGEQTEDEAMLEDTDMTILSEYLSHDSYMNQESLCQSDIGRTTELTRDYTPVVAGGVKKNANSLMKMWVNTLGTPDIRCGDIVNLVTRDTTQMMAHQFIGYWMVERVIHHISNTYITRLLLTRPGIDTHLDTTLDKTSPSVYKGTSESKMG